MLILRILELCTLKVCLFFNKVGYFLMCSIVSVCLQTLLVNNLKTLIIKNAKFSEYYYYTNTNIWRSLTVYYYHVTYEIRVNAHSIVGLNVMELPGQSRAHIWSWSGSNEIRTHINLVRKPNQSVLGPNTIAPTWRSFLICISVPLNLKLTNQRLTLLGVRVHMGAWFFWITIDLSSPLLHSKFFH